ncbi:hypothetical protein BY996DRAFT_8394442 [Phakopsora pachyrhizi]|nr:hypothetical protein BY996DRAFT_8394442 [Phakopsora pachyrhizi]
MKSPVEKNFWNRFCETPEETKTHFNPKEFNKVNIMAIFTHPTFIIVMGVSGCGKLVVGKELARFLSDQFPCLKRVRENGIEELQSSAASSSNLDSSNQKAVVIACSALKRKYWQTLSTLSIINNTIAMLESQLKDLEEPGVSEEENVTWAVSIAATFENGDQRSINDIAVDGMYRSVKRLGIPDSNTILMLADNMACNPRNMFPGMVYSNADRKLDLYGVQIKVDYRGDEVSVENFIRLLTGRVAEGTPRSKETDDGREIERFGISDKSWEEGNACFKNGDIATAVKNYTESIKRNPSDSRAYTNQAASNSKLIALPEALKDTNSAIEVDPNFTKAYIRKALTLLAMKDCRHNRSDS